MWCPSSQETTDNHPHLDTVIAALGLVQNNGKSYKIWHKMLFYSVSGWSLGFDFNKVILQNRSHKSGCLNAFLSMRVTGSFFFYFSLSPGSTTVIPNFRLSDIIPPASDLHHYYRYVGSMTTPGCEHAVAWTVFHRTLSISSRQVRNFWTFYVSNKQWQ